MRFCLSIKKEKTIKNILTVFLVKLQDSDRFKSPLYCEHAELSTIKERKQTPQKLPTREYDKSEVRNFEKFPQVPSV